MTLTELIDAAGLDDYDLERIVDDCCPCSCIAEPAKPEEPMHPGAEEMLRRYLGLWWLP